MLFLRRSQRHFLEPEREAWLLDAFAFFARHLQPGHVAATEIVLPTRTFFGSTDLTGHDKAVHVFACVKRHMRMEDWPCELIAQPERPTGPLPGMTYAGFQSSGAAGTFRLTGNAAEISYSPENVDKPWRLIATLAHECAHYRLAAWGEIPPGGEDMLEPTTDLLTTAFGFGLFGANTAFELQGRQGYEGSGWSSARLGYLRERDWIFALALILEMSGKQGENLKPYLKDYLWTDLRAAKKSITGRADLIEHLRTRA